MFHTLLTAGVKQNVQKAILHLIFRSFFGVLPKLFVNSLKHAVVARESFDAHNKKSVQ